MVTDGTGRRGEMTEQNAKLLTLYSDVRATAVEWLWYPYIAVGKITLRYHSRGFEAELLQNPVNGNNY